MTMESLSPYIQLLAWGYKKCIQNFGRKSWKEETNRKT